MLNGPDASAVGVPNNRALRPFLRNDRWRRFGWITILAIAALALFTVLVGTRLGGKAVTAAVDDLGLAAFQFAAAISCFVAFRRASDRLKLPWALLAAASTSVGLGQLVWSVYELVFGITSPFPSAADLGNLVALPLSIAAGLTFPSAPGRGTTRGRALIDGAIVAIALMLVAWAVGVADIYIGPGASFGDALVGLVYMAGQALMLTVLVMAIRRAGRSLRHRLLFLTCAVTANIATITVFVYLATSHRFGPSARLIDSAFVFVYLLIVLAALWPERGAAAVAEEGPARTWAVALPAIAVGLAVLAVLGFRLLIGPFSTPIPWVLASVLIILLTTSQMLSYRDSLGLLQASKRAEAELQVSTSLLKQVVSHAPAGLARIGLDLRIIDSNPRMGLLLYATNQILVGSALTEYLPAEAVAKSMETFKRRDGNSTDTAESDSQALRADGSKVWVHWSVTAVRNAQGAIEYFLGLFEDIDAKHRAEQAAIANLSGLERLNGLKSEFVSLVSHEFRTALTGIQGFAELMRESDMEPAEVKSLSNDIFNDAARMNRLITDMLDVDRMEAGRMTFRLAPVDINATILETVDRAKSTTSRHNLTTDLDASIPPIAADSDRLIQVLSNLPSNAIKYSPGGGDVVVTSRKQDGAVEVSVKDQGKGIPADSIDRLFERFERVEDHLSAKTVGTGLGLAIARRIVEGQGGRIWVHSEVGVGSEFHFSLPIQAVGPGESKAPVTTAPAVPALAGSKS